VDTTGITKNNPLTPLIVALSDNNNSQFFNAASTMQTQSNGQASQANSFQIEGVSDNTRARNTQILIPPAEAIYEACLVRFRPIMMTTMAALMGTFPIALGFGAGGEARRPLGLAVVGGLVVSQTLTLYITPVFYLYMERFRSLGGKKRGLRREAAPEVVLQS